MDYTQAIDGQLRAYNTRDLEAYLSYYTEDVVGYDLDRDRTLFEGKAAMREVYRTPFQGSLNCKIESRMILGRTVVDYEQIYRGNRKLSRAVVLYELDKNGLIRRMIMSRGHIRKQTHV